MEILLVAATAMEMRAATAMLPGVTSEHGGRTRENPKDGPFFHLPDGDNYIRLGDKILRPAVCGVGPLNASFALGLLFARAAAKGTFPAGVISAGLAGTYAPQELPVGTAALANEENFPEYGLAAGGSVSTEGFAFYQYEDADIAIMNNIRLAPHTALEAMGLFASSLPEAPMATVSGCSATLEQARRVRARTGALAENMEGFALALACKHCSAFFSREVPFAEIRAISNAAGCRPPDTWNLDLALTSLGKAVRDIFLKSF